MAEGVNGADVFGGVVITFGLIAILACTSQIASCTARANVRHECDVYGKAELIEKDSSTKVFYKCERTGEKSE